MRRVDGKLDVPRIARVIQSVKPDLVALQEVDRNTTRTGKVDQATELAQLTRMNHVFGANIAFRAVNTETPFFRGFRLRSIGIICYPTWMPANNVACWRRQFMCLRIEACVY